MINKLFSVAFFFIWLLACAAIWYAIASFAYLNILLLFKMFAVVAILYIVYFYCNKYLD